MFSEKSEMLVTELINAEYHNARKNYGETIATMMKQAQFF